MKKVTVIGLGAMGFRVAQKLLAADYEVTVFNRNRSRTESLASAGAFVAATPREAAEKSEVVISMVTDVIASKEVWLDEKTGALGGLGKDAVAIESSTLTVAWVKELAQEISQSGAKFLDAPVIGSRPQAEAGELVYLVGGDAEIVGKIQPILSVMSSAVNHVGEVGAGTMMKLAVNALFGIQVAAFGELLGTLKSFGFEEAKIVELFGALPVTSPALKRIGGLMVSRSFVPNFPISLVEKDLGYLAQTAESLNCSAVMTKTAQGLFAEAKDKDFADADISGIYQLFETKDA